MAQLCGTGNDKTAVPMREPWCFSDRASWKDYIRLITNLMHWLLFIHKILYFSTCFEPQVLIFRRIQLYTCSIWYCHSLWEFVVACRYTAWVRTQAVYRQATRNCDSTICRGELSYLAPLGSENISAPYFKQYFFESNTTPPSHKTEITNILFYILNFASIIKFKM